MPVITDTSQESAVALHNCVVATPSLGPVEFVSSPAAFVVSQALYDCWVAVDLDAVALPNCRTGPCVTALCTPPVGLPRDDFEFPVSYSVELVLVGYDATITVNDGPPDADYTFDWGDGTEVPMLLDSDGNWTAAHTYAATPATYTLAVRDDEGVVASRALLVPAT
jgi:hypothetical protein